VQLPDTCFHGPGPHIVYAIGDWGGVVYPVWPHNATQFPHTGAELETADKRSSKVFSTFHRPWILGADDSAQLNVASQMKKRAPQDQPDYVLNVGDNFYWGGITTKCGSPMSDMLDQTQQFGMGFERIYSGPGLDNKQWLGVLGNHDYGGWTFTNGWDRAIAYTWCRGGKSTNRWLTPAQYWMAKAKYDDFSVDYYFVDNNHFDTFQPPELHHQLDTLHSPP